jgi:CRP/FNR family cyclic AMP-dependent transcriptional regulator
MKMSVNKIVQPNVFGRFDGESGRARAIDALKAQHIILGNGGAAEELLARGELMNFMPGDALIIENDWSNSVFFILAGAVDIAVKGNIVNHRLSGQHVGEMAVIDPSRPRSAQVTATAPTVTLTLSEENFAAVAVNHPDLWRQIAKELAERLRERSTKLRQANSVPHVFIACATESLPVAEAFKAKLASTNAVVTIWTEGVFKPSEHAMESLDLHLDLMDFAVAIFSPDDKVRSRGKQDAAPRDNTIFELGLFAGKTDRKRAFFAVPKGKTRVKIPSDLAGITSLRYSTDQATQIDVDEACVQIIDRITEKGCR